MAFLGGLISNLFPKVISTIANIGKNILFPELKKTVGNIGSSLAKQGIESGVSLLNDKVLNNFNLKIPEKAKNAASEAVSEKIYNEVTKPNPLPPKENVTFEQILEAPPEEEEEEEEIVITVPKKKKKAFIKPKIGAKSYLRKR